LDQAIAYGHGSVKTEEVHDMLGTISQQNLYPLLQALAEKNNQTLFDEIKKLADHALDFSQVLEEIIQLFHDIALMQLVPQLQKKEAAFSPLVSLFTPEDIQLYYQIALLGRRDLAYTPSPQQGFEMTMLRMLAFKPTISDTASVMPSEQLQAAPLEIARKAAQPLASLSWRELLPQLQLTGMAYALAANCILNHHTENKIELLLSIRHEAMLTPKLKERLQEAINQHFKHPMHLEIRITSDDISTPAKQQQQEQDQRLAQAKQHLLEHPQIKQFIEMYDATVDVASLT
jgi:DNA polymerase-3 subunit gamma/tau